jgi:hypothetical protein
LHRGHATSSIAATPLTQHPDDHGLPPHLRDALLSCISRSRLNRLRGLAAAIVLGPAGAVGSPGVPLDDPVYDALDPRALAGELPPFRGGLVPLTEARVRELGGDAPAAPDGAWLRPIERAALRIDAAHEAERGYSTMARPRDVAGELALSCADQVGRPCGHGLGLAAELDAAAGYGAWLAGAIRLRAQTGSERYPTALAVDRAYASAELGPIAVEVGRDALVLVAALRPRATRDDRRQAQDVGVLLDGRGEQGLGCASCPRRCGAGVAHRIRVHAEHVGEVHLGACNLGRRSAADRGDGSTLARSGGGALARAGRDGGAVH